MNLRRMAEGMGLLMKQLVIRNENLMRILARLQKLLNPKTGGIRIAGPDILIWISRIPCAWEEDAVLTSLPGITELFFFSTEP